MIHNNHDDFPTPGTGRGKPSPTLAAQVNNKYIWFGSNKEYYQEGETISNSGRPLKHILYIFYCT